MGEGHLTVLAEAGLVLEAFGGASFLITAAPAGVKITDLEALVLELLENLAPVKSLQESQTVQERARLLMACHGAIRAGQALSREEMRALLIQHGRSGSP